VRANATKTLKMAWQMRASERFQTCNGVVLVTGLESCLWLLEITKNLLIGWSEDSRLHFGASLSSCLIRRFFSKKSA
jgi:hypothetical protein